MYLAGDGLALAPVVTLALHLAVGAVVAEGADQAAHLAHDAWDRGRKVSRMSLAIFHIIRGGSKTKILNSSLCLAARRV
jgi:hypothetical protein